MLQTSAIDEYLRPLQSLLNDREVSEILINREKEVFVERGSDFEKVCIEELNHRHLMGLTNLIARYCDSRLSEKEPLLSGQLPSGHRVQVVLPPATTTGRVVIAIRQQRIQHTTLDDLAIRGCFDTTQPFFIKNFYQEKYVNEINDKLSSLFYANNFVAFLKEAIRLKKNIVISGATSTGKTTFLNACLQSIPLHEHLVTLEDVAEVKPPHELHTALFTSKGLQGTSQVTMQDLVQASLRLRPDRIILGELRGSEAADFINATATGHDGSLTSVHAGSPAAAFMRLVHMVKLSGSTLSREDILEDLRQVIDIVVQLRRRVVGHQSNRYVSAIYYENAKAPA